MEWKLTSREMKKGLKSKDVERCLSKWGGQTKWMASTSFVREWKFFYFAGELMVDFLLVKAWEAENDDNQILLSDLGMVWKAAVFFCIRQLADWVEGEKNRKEIFRVLLAAVISAFSSKWRKFYVFWSPEFIFCLV